MVVSSTLVHDLLLMKLLFDSEEGYFLRLYTEISFGRMKWPLSFTLGRNLDVLAEEESEEEEVDEGHKREVSRNITGHALVVWYYDKGPIFWLRKNAVFPQSLT